RFGYFKYAGADRPTLANERVVHRDSFRREIFPELAVLKRSAKLLFPPPQIFYGVRIHRFVWTPRALYDRPDRLLQDLPLWPRYGRQPAISKSRFWPVDRYNQTRARVRH